MAFHCRRTLRRLPVAAAVLVIAAISLATVRPGAAQHLLAQGASSVGQGSADFTVYLPGFAVGGAATWRVSVGASDAQGNGNSEYASISADGSQVAFHSYATNLVAGDTNGQRDVFVRDWVVGLTQRVSVPAGGGQANGASFNPRLSADGRFVAFESLATNLVAGDTNNVRDIFLHDRQTGTTTRVSVGTGGTQADGHSGSGPGGIGVALSADGSLIAYQSEASNLVAGDTNGLRDIFVYDRLAEVTTRVSVATGGAQAHGASLWPALSADGRYAAFYSDANDLVANDPGIVDVFLHDRQTGETTRVSVAPGGLPANSHSRSPALSADGRYVAFTSVANNLAPGDTNASDDLYIFDRQTGTTTLASGGLGGAASNGSSNYASLSTDGRFVAFKSTSSNLVVGDTNAAWDIFLYDRQTSHTTRLSVASGDIQADSDSNWLALSGDGRYVAFESTASNLVADDTNATRDIFVRDRGGP